MPNGRLMARHSPRDGTIRALFAKSGNVCAFPACTHELVANDDLYVAEICHIEAAEPRGPRYNPNTTDEVRRGYDNLVLLCHAHHRRVDSDVSTYTVEWLRQMKAQHESAVRDGAFRPNASVIAQVEREIESYWSVLARRQEEHPIQDLAVDVEPAASGIEVFRNVHTQLKRIEELLDHYRSSDEAAPNDLRELLQRLDYDLAPLDALPYYENPFELRNWEYHNHGSTNTLLDMKALQLHAELLYLTQHAMLHSNDPHAIDRMEQVKAELLEIAAAAVYSD